MFETLRDRFTDGSEADTDGGRADGSVLDRTENEAAGGPVSDDPATSDSATADPGEGAGGEDVDIGLDEIFGSLKNRRRRDVLRYLTAEAGKVRIGELAEEIAARECDKPVSHITSTERKRVYVALYQCHPPKLSDVGAVSYNQPRGTIEPGPNLPHFEHYLPAEEGVVDATRSGHAWARSLSSLLTR
jgi:hypothetical protein